MLNKKDLCERNYNLLYVEEKVSIAFILLELYKRNIFVSLYTGYTNYYGFTFMKIAIVSCNDNNVVRVRVDNVARTQQLVNLLMSRLYIQIVRNNENNKKE